MQFFSTVSSFLHNMIRHYVDFCKNEPRFMPLISFHVNCILLLMMKMNKKQFLFHFLKIKAEGRSPLIICIFFNCVFILQIFRNFKEEQTKIQMGFKFTRTHSWIQVSYMYNILSRNFNKGLILALLARFISSLMLCIANYILLGNDMFSFFF